VDLARITIIVENTLPAFYIYFISAYIYSAQSPAGQSTTINFRYIQGLWLMKESGISPQYVPSSRWADQ